MMPIRWNGICKSRFSTIRTTKRLHSYRGTAPIVGCALNTRVKWMARNEIEHGSTHTFPPLIQVCCETIRRGQRASYGVRFGHFNDLFPFATSSTLTPRHNEPLAGFCPRQEGQGKLPKCCANASLAKNSGKKRRRGQLRHNHPNSTACETYMSMVHDF